MTRRNAIFSVLLMGGPLRLLVLARKVSQTGAGFNGMGRQLRRVDETLATIGAASGQPILIAGPTASGKSALALHLAETQGGIVINADALQVFDRWPILTAQPTAADRGRAPHALYGHVAYDASYSVGRWLRDVLPYLTGPQRPIIVGGSGLYFSALTDGLALIPPVPTEIRVQADAMVLAELLAGIDPRTRQRIDPLNRARVQRAWEVQASTGRGLSDWQADTPAPMLDLMQAKAVVLRPDVDWLNHRITARFAAMLDNGALFEAKAMRPDWNPAHLSAKAIGAAGLIAHLDGDLSLDQARDTAIIASRQYAKRQRTWFRARMQDWTVLDPADWS